MIITRNIADVNVKCAAYRYFTRIRARYRFRYVILTYYHCSVEKCKYAFFVP